MGMLYPLWSCPTSAGEDDVVYYWPLRTMVARQVRAGQWPAWNGREAAGVPLLADPQTGLLFPPNWLFLVLPHRLAYSLCIFLAFSVAGGGAYLYLRRVGLATPAALFGGAAFMFCGFMVGHRVHLALIQTAALLGWGLWSIERIRSNARAAFAWMAPIFALTLAAGHWPTAIHMMLVWLAYLLLRGRPIGRALAVAAAAAVVGGVLLAPQIVATASYLRQSIRADTPYLVAGENSFFPLCAVLAFFPFIMGSRTPNFFPQQWWGPWHLCEMLGYVGLVTLALAASAVWRMYRKRSPSPKSANDETEIKLTDSHPWALDAHGADSAILTPLVRAWTWILIGAGVWALGYYLPTYRLIHRIPVIGMVRCPARMLLAIDFGLAALAAMAIHALATKPRPKLAKTVRRWATAYLPICMVASLLLLFIVVVGQRKGWWDIGPLLSGPTDSILTALKPNSRGVYVPAALAALTIAAIAWFLRNPRPRTWGLIILLLADLFFIARFVDVPGRGRPRPDPEDSPAARWLAANAPKDEPIRVWGLSRSYHHRPAELLLPKTCASLGFETISCYGPLQPSDHALLFGFRPWGANEHWGCLIRRNHLLSLYNVRYVLAADHEFRQVIESVRMPAQPPPADGPNLLKDAWSLRGARLSGEGLTLRAPRLWRAASARQMVSGPLGTTYRVALDVRAPKAAGNLVELRLGLPLRKFSGGPVYRRLLRVDVEQITGRWRRFEETFQMPGRPGATWLSSFQVDTWSDRPIEVRNISLRRSSWPAPINFGGRLAPGEPVYVDRTPDGLEPTNPDDPPVHVYENLLCLPRSFPVADAAAFADNERVIEALRWQANECDLSRQVLVAQKSPLPHGLYFISQNPGAWDGSAGSANGLGAVRAGAVSAAVGHRPPLLAGTLTTAAAVACYLLLVFAGLHRMNKADAGPVR